MDANSRVVRQPFGVGLATISTDVAEAARLRDAHIAPVVMDANALLAELAWRSRRLVLTVRAGQAKPILWPCQSCLSRSVAKGAVRLYAKADLIEEVRRHLPAFARDQGLDPVALNTLLEADYLPELRLVDLDGIDVDDANLALVVRDDPDDEPSARLSRLLDPSFLCTRDRDLIDHGFGEWTVDGWDDWTRVTRSIEVSAFYGEMLGGSRLTFGLTGASVEGVISAAQARPKVALIGFGLALLGFLALRRSERWPGISADVRQLAADAGQALAAGMNQRWEPAVREGARLREHRAVRPGPGTPVARVARTLALAPDLGLLLRDVRAILPDIADEVRPILETHPAFVREGWRWHLGVSASAAA
jgi:hypothetical protein